MQPCMRDIIARDNRVVLVSAPVLLAYSQKKLHETLFSHRHLVVFPPPILYIFSSAFLCKYVGFLILHIPLHANFFFYVFFEIYIEFYRVIIRSFFFLNIFESAIRSCNFCSLKELSLSIRN